MVRRSTINFSAHEFREQHGHMPRGVAIWIFYFADTPNEPWIARKLDGQIRAMTYLAAKDYARVEALRRKVTSVRVDANPL